MIYLLGFWTFLLLFLGTNGSGCNVNSPWMREKFLDDRKILHDPLDKSGKIMIRWNYTESNITILLVAKTRGWVGIGFYPNRTNFSGADFVVGWVDNGKSYLQDRHIEGTKLILDKENNYKMLAGSENDTSTIFCFQRQLQTCDKQDLDITFSTTLIVWAIGKKDPKNQTDILNLTDAKTGNKSVHMLNQVYSNPSIPNTETFDLTTRNITITRKEGTKYWCTHAMFPKTNEQHYMLGWEPKIQKENMMYVHHFILYICPTAILKDLYPQIDPNGYDCLDSQKMEFASSCIDVLAAWAIGGEGEYFPTTIAFPFGSVKEATYFKLEVHYNFQDDTKSIQDKSGIHLYHTKNLKPQNKAGIFPVGIHVAPFHILPPGISEMDTIGVCDTNCLKQKLPDEGLTIFMIAFHTHLTGRKVIFRRFRNGVELEPIADYNFDFEFQGFIFLDKPFNITKDDILVTECIYDTSNRTNTTVGNFPTKSEMCLAFLGYYPMVNLTSCLSMLLPQKVYDLVGIEQVAPLPNVYNCTGPQCPIPLSKSNVPELLTVLKPDECANITLDNCLKNYKSWNAEKIKTLQNLYYETQQGICWDNNGTFLSTEKDQAMFPKNFTAFKTPDVCKNIK